MQSGKFRTRLIRSEPYVDLLFTPESTQTQKWPWTPAVCFGVFHPRFFFIYSSFSLHLRCSIIKDFKDTTTMAAPIPILLGQGPVPNHDVSWIFTVRWNLHKTDKKRKSATYRGSERRTVIQRGNTVFLCHSFIKSWLPDYTTDAQTGLHCLTFSDSPSATINNDSSPVLLTYLSVWWDNHTHTHTLTEMYSSCISI